MSVRHPRLLLPALMAVALVLAASVAYAATVAPLTTVSGASPYAGCTVGGPGTVYVNAEVEPYVAINPANTSNIIGAWQQDRWNNGGSHGLMAGFSSNGGKNWRETPLPFSSCAPGGLAYDRASDPWVSIGPDGTAYAVSISFNLNATSNATAVGAATSTDGGKTWGHVQTVIADPSAQFFNDKESVTADPLQAGVAYVVWDRLVSPNGNPDADLHTAAFSGPAYFSKTTDGGTTWSAPQVIVNTGTRRQTIGNQIVVNRQNDMLYDFFDLIAPPFGVTATKLAFVKSSDGGSTWTQPQIVADMDTVGVTDPNTGAALRTGDIIPEVAIDPATGQLYAVWQDSRFNGFQYDEISFSTSANGGATWSTPKRVNTPSGKPAFNPSVQVDSTGSVGITYYDFRNLTNQTTTLPTDVWFVSSGNQGTSFAADTHLAGSFDMMTAPISRGFFVGDYQGLAASGGSFRPFFVQTNSGNTSNRTDVFTDTVAP